jgi:hypothetical protein
MEQGYRCDRVLDAVRRGAWYVSAFVSRREKEKRKVREKREMAG